MLAQALVQDEDLSIDFSSSLPGMFVVHQPKVSPAYLGAFGNRQSRTTFWCDSTEDNPKRLLPLLMLVIGIIEQKMLSRDEWFPDLL